MYDPPLTLDDFEELCVIGQGSSGVAKKVRNRRDGRLMVLKVIQFDVSSDVVRKQVRQQQGSRRGWAGVGCWKGHGDGHGAGGMGCRSAALVAGGSRGGYVRGAGRTARRAVHAAPSPLPARAYTHTLRCIISGGCLGRPPIVHAGS